MCPVDLSIRATDRQTRIFLFVLFTKQKEHSSVTLHEYTMRVHSAKEKNSSSTCADTQHPRALGGKRERSRREVHLFFHAQNISGRLHEAVSVAASGKGTRRSGLGQISFHCIGLCPNLCFEPGFTFSRTLRHKGFVPLRWGMSYGCRNSGPLLGASFLKP